MAEAPAALALPLRPEERRAQTPLPAGLIHVWVNKGQNGYGIYFKTLPDDCGMLVSKLDHGSEAEGAGVQVGDQLVLLNDCDIRFDPFKDTLDKVRVMSACKMTFVPRTEF